jgi:hypothetical protein
MLGRKNDDAAMHAMLALTRRGFSAGLAWDVSVKLEHRLSLDHDPGDPGISYGEHHKQANHGACAEGEELNTKGKGEEDTSSEDIDGPFESHQITFYLHCLLSKRGIVSHAE